MQKLLDQVSMRDVCKLQ